MVKEQNIYTMKKEKLEELLLIEINEPYNLNQNKLDSNMFN